MARFVIYGAGAVGGVLGGRLFEHGEEVVLIARGEHYAAITRDGLRIDDPEGSTTLRIPAVDHPSSIEFRPDDVVVLAMKTQDTAPALETLASLAPSTVTIACAQNGVANEPLALRWFPNVYGLCVVCVATYVAPGRVVAHTAPITGLFDLGRYPSGLDQTATAVGTALAAATYAIELRHDVMRWKYAKLVRNLANSIHAICGPTVQLPDLAAAMHAEAAACLDAAGIDSAKAEEWTGLRATMLQFIPVEGFDVVGGSTWQSLVRGTGSVETDYLNGEIVLLGRLHGIPTPVNNAVTAIVRDLAARRAPPGGIAPDELRELVGRG
jgi:2-dehydropantoate 2-reductase